jgi:transposase
MTWERPTRKSMSEHQQGSSPHNIVVGVDTHRDFHVAAAIDSRGALLGSHTFPATQAGYTELVA